MSTIYCAKVRTVIRQTNPVVLWSKIRLLDLFNVEIVSKHKYHSACFGQDFCLKAAQHAFTITASVVAQYCLHQYAVVAPASWTPSKLCGGVMDNLKTVL